MYLTEPEPCSSDFSGASTSNLKLQGSHVGLQPRIDITPRLRNSGYGSKKQRNNEQRLSILSKVPIRNLCTDSSVQQVIQYAYVARGAGHSISTAELRRLGVDN